MKFFLAFLFFMDLSVQLFSQQLVNRIYVDSSCGSSGLIKITFTENEYPKFIYGNLSDFFRKHFTQTDIIKIYGIVETQLIVNRDGKVCCKSIVNNTNFSNKKISALKLQEIINKMPLWIPAKENGKTISATLLVQILFNKTNVFKVEIIKFNQNQTTIEEIH